MNSRFANGDSTQIIFTADSIDFRHSNLMVLKLSFYFFIIIETFTFALSSKFQIMAECG